MDTTTNGAKPRKAREQKPVKILLTFENESGEHYWVFKDGEDFDSTQEAEKWITNNGQDNQQYTVVTIHRKLTVKVLEVVKTVRMFQ